MIIVNEQKSDRSSLLVWQVSINKEQAETRYCTTPLNALRYCFMLKKQTGARIAPETLGYLCEMNRYQKALSKA